MISSISIGNFKAFADKQTLPIKPITLIFGANSSGKSSIIHSLLLANEVLTQEKLNLDINFTKLGGESVDLGGFRQFVNRRDSSSNVVMGFEIEQKKLSKRLQEIFYSVNSIQILIEFGLRYFDFETPGELRVTSIEILTDNSQLLKMSFKGIDEVQMDVIDIENKIIKAFFEALVISYTTSDIVSVSDTESFKNALSELVPKLTAKMNKLIPEGLNGLENFSDPRINAMFPTMQPVNKENREEILKKITMNVLPFILDEMFSELNKYISYELNKLIYLGPLRSYPERHFNFRKSNDNNWYAGGGYAWEVVASNKEVMDKVNEWLGSEKLRTNYKLELIEMIGKDILEKIISAKLSKSYHDAIANYILESSEGGGDGDSIAVSASEITEEIIMDILYTEDEDFVYDDATSKLLNDTIKNDENIQGNSIILESHLSSFYNFEMLTKNWIEEFISQRSEIINDLVLIDKRINTKVSLRDVGIGVSQVLPVLVTAFANKEKIIAIEQPEIHLHPALQAELGDLFINSALGENKNSFILETHSEHLILRILRRIRETTNNELKEGMIPVRPEDVQIVFVRPSDKGAEIINLEINEEGDFKTKWPDGFFEERAEELF